MFLRGCLGFKELIQLSLKPKNPNLSSKSQRGSKSISNLRAESSNSVKYTMNVYYDNHIKKSCFKQNNDEPFML